MELIKLFIVPGSIVLSVIVLVTTLLFRIFRMRIDARRKKVQPENA